MKIKSMFFHVLCLFSIIAQPAYAQPLTTQQKLEGMLNLAIADNDSIATLTLLKVFDELGFSAPRINLCNIVLPKRTLYCKQNLGIKRIDMPQLSGKPRLGSRAAELPADKNGVVNAGEAFKQYLIEKGFTITPKEVSSAELKATQNELIGSKIASMWWSLKQDPSSPWLKDPIFISSDNYVLDGHHRWAALTGTDFEDGELGDVKMKTMQINATMKDLVGFANTFAAEFGILPEAGVGK